MEEINVAQEMEQAVDEVVLPNDNSVLYVVAGVALVGGLIYTGVKAYKWIKSKAAKAKDSKEEVKEKTIVDSEVVSEN